MHQLCTEKNLLCLELLGAECHEMMMSLLPSRVPVLRTAPALFLLRTFTPHSIAPRICTTTVNLGSLADSIGRNISRSRHRVINEK